MISALQKHIIPKLSRQKGNKNNQKRKSIKINRKKKFLSQKLVL